MTKSIRVTQIKFWLGDHVPFEHSQFPGPTAWGERQDLLIKLYRGESTSPWWPIVEKSLEPVTRDEVDWPEVYKSSFNERL